MESGLTIAPQHISRELRETHVSTAAEFKQPVLELRWNNWKTHVTLQPIMETHTQAIHFMFGPVGLFEEAKALEAEEQSGRSVGCAYSIMMALLHKALVSRPLTELLETQSVYLYFPESWADPSMSISINIC